MRECGSVSVQVSYTQKASNARRNKCSWDVHIHLIPLFTLSLPPSFTSLLPSFLPSYILSLIKHSLKPPVFQSVFSVKPGIDLDRTLGLNLFQFEVSQYGMTGIVMRDDEHQRQRTGCD